MDFLHRFKFFVLQVIVILIFGGKLSAQTPHHYNYENVGLITNNFPLGMPAGRAVNWIFLPGEFSLPNPAPQGKRITKIYFYMSITGPAKTYTNLQIMMRQDTDTSFTSAQFDPGPWDTLFFGDTTLQGFMNQWMGITLQKKFNYDPTKSLKVFVGQCAATGNGGGTIRMIELPGNRRVWSSGGCPYVPWPTTDSRIPNIGFDLESITNIPETGTNIPSSYLLEQNYPNPFNPSTMINFAIPKSGLVSLKVYDVLGLEVKSLVNEIKNAGSYSVEFDASNLSSGMYFYLLEVNGYADTKNMMLVK